MAALGAAAGAFEGDQARAEAAARRAQLNLGHARLQEDARQFAEQSRVRQSENEADRLQRQTENEENTRRFEVGRGDQQAASERQQANADRQFQQGERQFQLTERQVGEREKDRAFERDLATRQEGRAAKSSEWEDVIKEQELEFQKQQYLKYKTINDEAAQEKADRQRIAQTATAALLRSTVENGGFAHPNALKLYSKDTGLDVRQVYVLNDGSVAMDIMKDGQMVTEPISVPILQQIYRSMPGIFGDMDKTLAANFLNQQKAEASAAGRSQSNRDKVLLDERKTNHELLNKHQSGEAVLDDTKVKWLYTRNQAIDKYLGLTLDQPLDEKGAVGDDESGQPKDGEVRNFTLKNGKTIRGRWDAASKTIIPL